MKVSLLAINIDKVTSSQALETVNSWLSKKGKHYIVTPNIEMIVDAQKDREFRKALNSADLAIPDSSRIGWGLYMTSQKNPLFKIPAWPLFLFPHAYSFPVVTGTDLMEQLISLSVEKGLTIGLLGGKNNVAIKLRDCLKDKYPKIRLKIASSDIEVETSGKTIFGPTFNAHQLSEKVDILFVAFGHIKQEKWMYQNLPKLNARVMMGVGGAFDYLSGNVPRAPKWLRSLGLEWLYRGILQPWRLKRFTKLLKFILLVLT